MNVKFISGKYKGFESTTVTDIHLSVVIAAMST